jgi:hypothetical protein
LPLGWLPECLGCRQSIIAGAVDWGNERG